LVCVYCFIWCVM